MLAFKFSPSEPVDIFVPTLPHTIHFRMDVMIRHLMSRKKYQANGDSIRQELYKQLTQEIDLVKINNLDGLQHHLENTVVPTVDWISNNFKQSSECGNVWSSCMAEVHVQKSVELLREKMGVDLVNSRSGHQVNFCLFVFCKKLLICRTILQVNRIEMGH